MTCYSVSLLNVPPPVLQKFGFHPRSRIMFSYVVCFLQRAALLSHTTLTDLSL